MDISRAPEPEDIRWQNIGRNDFSIYCRKFITYSITIGLLGLSFAAVLGLSRAQDSNKKDAILGFVISITIVLINGILGRNFFLIQR